MLYLWIENVRIRDIAIYPIWRGNAIIHYLWAFRYECPEWKIQVKWETQ